jgi:hypothetical protein
MARHLRGLPGREVHEVTRCAPAVAGAAVAVLLTAAPAMADDPDPVVVDRSAFGWVLTKVTDPGSVEVKRERPSRRAAPARVCRQTKSESAGGYATEAQLASGDYPNAGPGGWVVRRCSDGALDMAWVPARPITTTPAQLAQRATNRLRLPLPVPQFEPRRQSSAGPATLVAIPTWFYLDGWAPVTQRTRAGGVWAEVTAAPVSATWWPGDGSAPVRCVGPGRAWTSMDPAASAPWRR